MILDWYLLAWDRSFNFRERATRRESAAWLLVNACLFVLFRATDRFTGLAFKSATVTPAGVFVGLILLPTITISARRLRDLNLSGLLALPVLVGVGFALWASLGAFLVAPLLFILLPGTRGANRFGPDPRDRIVRYGLLTWARGLAVRRWISWMLFLLAIVVLGCGIAESQTERGRVFFQLLRARMHGAYSVEDRLVMFDEKAARIPRPFARPLLAGRLENETPWRGDLTILVFKDQRRLEIHEKDPSGTSTALLVAYPILGMSGHLGPKLKEGDLQVPEGIYDVVGLNPNSRFHVSMHLGYPNQFDWSVAKRDGRSELGSFIMIHGSNLSTGCLAMGDDAIEVLFDVVGRNQGKCRLIIAPTDLRVNPAPTVAGFPSWAPELYAQIKSALLEFPRH